MPDFTPSDVVKARQQLAILGWLKKHGSISSLEAREGLGILHPAGRILELRRYGFDIQTKKSVQIDANGRRHGVAVYEYVCREEDA